MSRGCSHFFPGRKSATGHPTHGCESARHVSSSTSSAYGPRTWVDDDTGEVWTSHRIRDTLGKSAEGRRSPTNVLSMESNLKEFQRGRPTGLDDDVKANAVRPPDAEGDFGRSEFAAAIPYFC